MVGIAMDEEGRSRLFIGVWNGTAYQTVTTPKQAQRIYLNKVHSTWDYLEIHSEAVEFSMNIDNDGLWRMSRIGWYDEADASDHAYYLNDAWVIDQGIDEYSEWQNNDGYLYGRYVPGCLMTEMDLSLFPCEDMSALLDTAGYACTRTDGASMFDSPDGEPVAACYARLTGTVTEEQGDWVCVQLGSTERGMKGWFHRKDLAFDNAVNEVVCSFPAYEDGPIGEELFPQLSQDELWLLELDYRYWLVGQTSEGNWLVMANQDAIVTAPAEAFTDIGPTEHYWDEEDEEDDE